MSSRTSFWIKLIVPLLLLGLGIAGANYIVTHKPEAATRKSPPPKAQRVDATRLQPQAYQIELESYGTVKPRTESQLVAQVGGAVTALSEQFREGAFFEAGDLLMQIDERDYLASVEVAEAALAQARAQLKEEQARSDQAVRDWQRLGKGKASELVLRKPQLAAAKAAIASAKAQLSTAKLNLERTKIRAPYAGRVLSKSVDLGQVVSNGTALGEIFAVDYVEVRLPLSNRQLEYIDLPEQYRGGEFTSSALPKVVLSTQIGRNRYEWQGKIIRVEGAIDSRSRQLFVVAQVEDPYSLGPQGNPPLKIGQFVEARIEGQRLETVFVLPRAAMSQDHRVMVIEQGRLQPRTVEPLWMNRTEVVVADGFSQGDLLSLTPLGGTQSGVLVQPRIDGELLPQKQAELVASSPVDTGAEERE
ncbi:efflux RND transporter periplasmic adaptor subunit [Motiliproteus sp.]|uniref:efflux RND transporter periplasmic adaptor subunit n=1 Tax=Motiliproteus sp. TaxID=1898955 RepID=UPI003BABC768